MLSEAAQTQFVDECSRTTHIGPWASVWPPRTARGADANRAGSTGARSLGTPAPTPAGAVNE